MKQKEIGFVLIIASILIALFVYNAHQRESDLIREYMEDEGTCYLDDGTCLHERSTNTYILGGIASAGLLILGIYSLY